MTPPPCHLEEILSSKNHHLSVPSRLNFEGGRDWTILIIQDPKSTINVNKWILRWRLFVENWGMFKVHSEIVGRLYRQNFELLGNQSRKIQRPLVFVRRTLHSFWGKECCRENVVDCWFLPSLGMAVRVHHRPYHPMPILFLRLNFCRSSCSCRRCEKKSQVSSCERLNRDSFEGRQKAFLGLWCLESAIEQQLLDFQQWN